ncbi:FAD-binding oxidoreductase [Aspergillus ruber CBS 135680]|uniref:FAD binding domain protein n=1 Tax=Aspergillus ruber (strain CBS 135680) TaxID=1388766 RepID=A0A017S1U4_ASPRC|nr:FAD binding domain protein [Aspergillus ruber CBS 135680]EYE90816.1 FAD binding domain protein [Aspergillus ruber CBS 135680]
MEIIWRDSATYEHARFERVYNLLRPNRYPAAIVRAKSESDIVEAVRLAHSKGLRIAVRSGGHSFAVWSVRDHSILLDLGDYREVTVDAAKREARVSPSTQSNLDLQLMKDYGLMFGGGHCPDVSLGGYLLQGGIGWNCRNWGWGCEQVKAVDVVTADGRLVHCNTEENSDLFWAARGAGPGFPGIVTRFHLQLHPAPKVFRTSGYMFPKTHYREAFNWILGLTSTFDDGTEISASGMYPDGKDEVAFFVYMVTMKDTAEEAQAALLPAQQTRPPGAIEEWFCREDSLEQEYATQENAYPGGRRWLADNAFIRNDVDLAAVLEDAFLNLPDNNFTVLWYPLAPRSRRPLPDMACSLQSDHYFGVYAIYQDERDDERCLTWQKQTMEKVERFSVGTFTGETDFQHREAKYWGDEQGLRLAEIRRKWDPEGRICGYLDREDTSGVGGLSNRPGWQTQSAQL